MKHAHHSLSGVAARLAAAEDAATTGTATIIGGGADIGQQLIRSALIDELSLHLVPRIFGGGTRMFENLGEELRSLEAQDVVSAPTATHLRYRFKRSN
jgi:dihydrofolate reductase